MRTIIIRIALVAAMFPACNNTIDRAKETTTNDTAQTSKVSTMEKNKPEVLHEVVTAYLQLKNALASDNAKDAASSGKFIMEALGKVDETSLNTSQKKIFDDVKDDIKENAEHISANEGRIAHQREHFDMLSIDMYDLIKAVNPGQTLYKDHCPMYNDGKGAIWLSEFKDIKNPYLGKKMPDCGSIKEKIE